MDPDPKKEFNNLLVIKSLLFKKDIIKILNTPVSLNGYVHLLHNISGSRLKFEDITPKYRADLIELFLDTIKHCLHANEHHNLVNAIFAALKTITIHEKNLFTETSLPMTFLGLIEGLNQRNIYDYEESFMAVVFNLIKIYKINSEKMKGVIEKIKSLKSNEIFSKSWYLFLIMENIENDFKYDLDSNILWKLIESGVNNANLNLAVKYINQLNMPESLFLSDECMNILYVISDESHFSFDSIDSTLQMTMVQTMINFLIYLYESIDEYFKSDKRQDSKLKIKFKRALYFVQLITRIVENYSNTSVKYCIMYHKVTDLKQDGIKTLFNFIDCEQLIDFLVESFLSKNNYVCVQLIKLCFEGVIGALHNLSRVNYKYYKLWNVCDAINSCFNFSKKLNSIDNDYSFYVYMLIANVASDKQIDTLPEIKMAIKSICDLIRDCSRILELEHPSRTKIQLNEKEDLVEACLLSMNNGKSWNLIELLEAIYRMSVNDSTKKDIYDSFEMKSYLKIIIYKGNDVEKEYSLKLLYQLCFDETIVNKLRKETELIKYIEDLSMFQGNRRNGVVRNSNGILWKLKDKRGKLERSLTNEKCELSTTTKNLMFSYNRESRDLCLAIKSALEKKGEYKIWIDIENIRGSSLESMASAIENCQCVVMCMTEKFKLSANCRLEAEYAVRIGKPIVPLILQKDYMPDGWLGIILGSKVFINFKKYDFDECIRKLNEELLFVFNSHNNQLSHAISQNNPEEVEKEDPNGWSEEEVQNWLNEKNINPVIVNYLVPLDGFCLYELFLTLKTSTDFFLNTIRLDCGNKITIKDIVLFSAHLRKLFESKNH